jgi:hypothetical protein
MTRNGTFLNPNSRPLLTSWPKLETIFDVVDITNGQIDIEADDRLSTSFISSKKNNEFRKARCCNGSRDVNVPFSLKITRLQVVPNKDQMSNSQSLPSIILIE